MVLRSENNMADLHVNMLHHYLVCLAVILQPLPKLVLQIVVLGVFSILSFP